MVHGASSNPTSVTSSGTRQAALAQGPQRAEGHQVVGDEDGVGRAGPVEQRAGGPVPALLAEVGPAHQVPVLGQAPPLQRVAVAGQAGLGVAQAGRAGDAADPRGAAVEQMIGGLAGAEAVVDEHRVDRRAPGPPVDRHDRDARLDQRLERRLAGRGHGDDHAGHAVGDGDVDVGGLLVDVLVGVAQHEAVVLALGDVLDAPQHRGEEGVLDVGDDRRPQRGALPAQGPGRPGRLVAERLGRLAHPLGALGRHGGGAVEHPRHRRGAHPGLAGDVADRGHGRRSPVGGCGGTRRGYGAPGTQAPAC